jgi:16S rRNA processing protein RimM
MSLVRIGRLGRPHGVQGEMTLDGCALTPAEMTGVRRFVWRSRGGEERPLTLRAARPAHVRMLVHFAECADRDDAAALVNGDLWADAEKLPDPGPGVAYTFQLVGMTVRTDDGRDLGTLEEVMRTGANDVYVVRGEKELLVPANADTLRNVDMKGRVITVRLPAGLEDL